MINRQRFKQFVRIDGWLLALLLLSISCSPAQPTPPPPENPVVARVDGLEFTLAELEQELAIDRATYKLSNGKPLILQDLSSTLQGLIPTLLLAQRARAANLTASEAEIEAELDYFLANRELTVAELERELTTYGTTLEAFKEYLARQIRIEKYLTEAVPPDADLHLWLVEMREQAEVELLYQPPAESPLVGSAAPVFELPALSGGSRSLAQFQGQPVILNFWASWCVPCKDEMPVLQQLQDEHAAAGLVVIGLNFEEEEFLARPFIEEVGVDFPNLLDRQGSATQSYGVTGIPTTVFIDRQGIIRHVQLGELNEALLAELLPRIL